MFTRACKAYVLVPWADGTMPAQLNAPAGNSATPNVLGLNGLTFQVAMTTPDVVQVKKKVTASPVTVTSCPEKLKRRGRVVVAIVVIVATTILVVEFELLL